MKKRVLSLILAVVMVLCLVPAISMVSFAAEEDYSILPDDTNKAHFLSLVEAYKDDVAVPAAALINAKLNGYLAKNKELSVAEQAEIIANTIRMFALDDDAHAENVQIITEYLTAKPLSLTTDQMNTAKAIAKKLVYVDGATVESGFRLYSSRMTANLLAWNAVQGTNNTTVDENLAPAWAAAIYAAGVWTPEAENAEAAQTAYVAAAINKIIADNSITSLNRQHGDNVFTPLCDAVEFRSSITNAGTNNGVGTGNFGNGIGHNNDGPWVYISSGIEQIIKQTNYGTNKVADFYLNFTDVAVADDAEKFEVILNYYFAPGTGNYGYYEDLWYDDGHLVYFVDTSGFTNEYTVTANSVLESEGSTTQVAATPSHFARFVKPAIIGNSSALNNTVFRPHVKVVGGYEIGRYFTVGTNANDVTLSASIDDEGYLRIMNDNGNNRWNVTNYGGFGRFSGIFLTYLYSYRQLSEKLTHHAHNAWANNNLTDYNYYQDNGISMTANADGFYGGYTIQFATRLDLDYWSNAHYSSFAGAVNANGATTSWNVYATNLGYMLLGQGAADGSNTYNCSGALIHLSARSDGNGGYVRTYTSLNTGYNVDGGLKLGGNAHAGDVGDFMAITVSAKYIDPVNKIAATTFFDLNGKILIDNRANDKTANMQVADTNGDKFFYPFMRLPHRSPSAGSADTRVNAIVQMQDKLMSNFRAYDVDLTQEQIAQNNFADLVYILGVDMTVYNALSDFDKESVRNLYGAATPDSVTKAEIEEKFAELAAEKGYDDYAYLWYDDGHLMSFVDLMNITEEERAERHEKQYSWNEVIGHRNVLNLYSGDYRLVNGYSLFNVFNRTYGRPFVKIIGGANAGNWYMITSKDTSTHKFPTVDGGFTDFGDTSNGYTAGERTGVLVGKTFTPSEIVGMQSFDLSNNTTDIVGDSYMMPAVNGGNAYTVDASVYIGANAKQYPYSVFLAATSAAQSPDATNLFGTTANTPAKQTESYGTFVNAQSNSDRTGIDNFVVGFAGRYGGFSGKSNIGGSFHLASIVNYENAYSFMTSYKVLLDNPTDGHKVVSKQANYAKAAVAGHDEYPFYGAYAHMSTVMACLANNNYYYYLRVYDVELTDLQMMQNHFADLMYFNKIDTAKYDALSENDKMTLWAWATDIQLSDADSKALVEGKIDELADKAGELVNFVGYQARVSKNVGVRSVFYLDNAALEGYTVKAYGAIVSAAVAGVDFDDLVIDYNAENGEVSVSSNFLATKSTDTDFKTIGNAEKAYILRTSENLDDYTMFAYTMNYINGSIDEEGNITGTSMIETLKDTELFFRAFAVVEYKGVTYIHYADGASANYNNTSVSLAEVSEYYAAYNNGEFADNVCIKAVVGNGDEE
ncbi:MAG: hypothetical protein IKA74_05985 [Clostridia bacterium]|nr:hypothetical protein [Clostridia bacterium]